MKPKYRSRNFFFPKPKLFYFLTFFLKIQIYLYFGLGQYCNRYWNQYYRKHIWKKNLDNYDSTEYLQNIQTPAYNGAHMLVYFRQNNLIG